MPNTCRISNDISGISTISTSLDHHPPAINTDPANISRLVDLIAYKVYAELKSETQRSYLGLFWWIVEPVLFMFIFYFVFDVLFARSVPDFIPFLLAGLTMWHWMQSTIVQCGNSISSNRSLIQQVLVPKAVFPAVIIVANFAKFLFVLSILFIFLFFYGIEPTWGWLYCIPVIIVAVMMISGLGFLLASIIPLIPDIRVLVDNGFRAVFFLSGIFYDINAMPERISSLLNLNPFALLITAFRGAAMSGSAPDLAQLSAVCAFSIATLCLGLFIMRRKRSAYAKALI